jgi:serine/threonine protein kinase
LFQLLGGGPLTQVFAGRERASDRPCAVKIVREETPDRDTAIELLTLESEVGLAVRHPHLVRIHTAQVDDSPYFLVMDLVGGETLRRRLEREYRVHPAQALWMIRQTAEALAALHRAGFVHGDVKPDNIRLTEDGTATLIDLGFAHRPGEHDQLRSRGYLLGTANYLAPELCLGGQDSGPAADLFSLGVTLFEMLAGELPYPPGNMEQTLKRHASDPPFTMSRCRADLPVGLCNLVARLLDRKPSRRPKATQVVAQLISLEIATFRRRTA